MIIKNVAAERAEQFLDLVKQTNFLPSLQNQVVLEVAPHLALAGQLVQSQAIHVVVSACT